MMLASARPLKWPMEPVGGSFSFGHEAFVFSMHRTPKNQVCYCQSSTEVSVDAVHEKNQCFKRTSNSLIASCFETTEKLVNSLSVEVRKNKITWKEFLYPKAHRFSVVVLKKEGNVGLAHFDL